MTRRAWRGVARDVGRPSPGVSALASVIVAASVKSGGAAVCVRCCRRSWRTGC